jgi:hypothetical protein
MSEKYYLAQSRKVRKEDCLLPAHFQLRIDIKAAAIKAAAAW